MMLECSRCSRELVPPRPGTGICHGGRVLIDGEQFGLAARWENGGRDGAFWRRTAMVARGLILLHHGGRDAAALTDRQTMLFRPGPDIPRALPARCGPPGPASPGTPGPAGMLNVGRELLAQRGGVLGIQDP